MKVVAFLPVKASSERIPNKNITLLDGKPLFLHTLQKLAACDFIDEVYLDSESDHIFNLGSEVCCKHLHRDPALSTNKTDGNQLFYNEVRQVEADIYVQILATSPFVEKDTIKKAIDILKESSEYDSVVLVRRDKLYTWDSEGLHPHYSINHIPNSKDLKDTIIETMSMYVIRSDIAHRLQRRIGERPFLLSVSPIESVDIDVPEDFDFANIIAAGKREKERAKLVNIAKQLSSSIVSDVLDNLGIKGKVISGMQLNLPSMHIFGRAKTLKIRRKKTTESTSIYDALNTYDTVVPNDVIVVENELSDYAYFGELNANLAIRSGAAGAIIGGHTRDSSEVLGLNFPVFSKGYNCQDIKHVGTIAHYNEKIQIEGVTIEYEDLVFGDKDGIVVIPQSVEENVLTECIKVIQREKNILIEIALGKPVSEIRAEYGDF